MSRPMATHIEGIYQSTMDDFHTVSNDGQLSQAKTFGQALEETLADEQDQLDGIILFLEEELEQYNDFLHVLQNGERGIVSELESAFEDYDSDRITFSDWQSRQARYQDELPNFLAQMGVL